MSVLCLAAVLIFFVATAAASSSSCSIKRYGSLTMFNGDTEKVELPCKYRLADISCGNYRIKVTPGSSLDGNRDNRFSPDTVWVSINKMDTDKKWIGRTSSRMLQGADADAEVWVEKQDDLRLDVAGYDVDSQSAVLAISDVFTVTFSRGSDDDGVTVTCTSPTRNLTSGAYPKSLCGDGTKTGTMVTRKKELFEEGDDSNHAMALIHDILRFTNIFQSERCQNIARDFQACSPKKKADVTRICGPILITRRLARCLIDDVDDVGGFDKCMKAVCHGSRKACRSLKDMVDTNCKELATSFTELKC